MIHIKLEIQTLWDQIITKVFSNWDFVEVQYQHTLTQCQPNSSTFPC